jgi:hypothetical protein
MFNRKIVYNFYTLYQGCLNSIIGPRGKAVQNFQLPYCPYSINWSDNYPTVPTVLTGQTITLLSLQY